MKITDRDSYKSYTGNLTKKQYFQVIDALLKRIPRYLIDDGKPINLLSRIGTVQVMKYKPVNRRPDWFNTRKYGKMIYHENFHTDGWTACLRWHKNVEATFHHKGLWAIDMTRDNLSNNNGKETPNSLAEVIKRNGLRKYHEI